RRERAVATERLDPVGERLRVSGTEEKAVPPVADELSRACAVGTDHGFPKLHSLYGHTSERFVQRARERDVGRRHMPQRIRCITGEAHPRFDSQLPDESAKLRPVIRMFTSDESQTDVQALPNEKPEGPDRVLLPFALADVTGEREMEGRLPSTPLRNG